MHLSLENLMQFSLLECGSLSSISICGYETGHTVFHIFPHVAILGSSFNILMCGTLKKKKKTHHVSITFILTIAEARFCSMHMYNDNNNRAIDSRKR